MITHEDIWRGIDRLAEKSNLTSSGLAVRAGLDKTSFNPSKRTSRDGRPKWPSMETLAKILDATDTSLSEFVELMKDGDGPPI